MSTGYEHLSSAAFWAEVRELLDLLARHHGGTRGDHVTGLADYVRAEAERRDPELGANTARCVAMIAAAWDRADFNPLTQLAADVPFTATEMAEFDQMGAAYRARFAELAGAGT